MKTETILTRVNEIMNLCDNSDLFLIRDKLSNLADDLAAQVRMEYATSRGQGNATHAVAVRAGSQGAYRIGTCRIWAQIQQRSAQSVGLWRIQTRRKFALPSGFVDGIAGRNGNLL